MKFANLKFNSKSINNIGDNMQLIAIDHIYNQMGIEQNDLIYIDKDDLSSYYGEYVVLPVSMPLTDHTTNGIAGRFSKYIIPVFLGLTLAKNTLEKIEVEYYLQHQPIGCRDQKTLDVLRSYNIQAYLHGCITATLPLREPSVSPKSVFIVDPAPELLPFIPEHILASSFRLTHSHLDIADPKALMHDYYSRYKTSASLVITSLLHCAVPCMAAGIPTILARNSISYRFGWLDKLLPLYDSSDFPFINWSPAPVSYEPHKQRLLDLSIKRIQDTFHKYSSLFAISWFYEDRSPKTYVNDALEPVIASIDRIFSSPRDSFDYAIWGLTQISDLVFDYISLHYPQARLVNIYDTYKQVSFKGLMSRSPEFISPDNNEIVLGTSFGGYVFIEHFLRTKGFTEDNSAVWRPTNITL